MADSNIKQKILEALAQLPADATYEDAIQRLCFLAKVEEGLAQADAGQLIPHQEIVERFNK